MRNCIAAFPGSERDRAGSRELRDLPVAVEFPRVVDREQKDSNAPERDHLETDQLALWPSPEIVPGSVLIEPTASLSKPARRSTSGPFIEFFTDTELLLDGGLTVDCL